MGHDSAVRRDEIPPLATTWMDFEVIALSEISRTERVKLPMTLFLCGIEI